jgi:cytochrome d ubiquinol oxidase subunit I
MEFQFGTNWARFSTIAGPVIGQTLGMESMFAFFLESSFLALLVYGEKRLSPRGHLLSAIALWAGSWLSGYFIVATNAFMQHPQSHGMTADGKLVIEDFFGLLFNRWAIAEFAHVIIAAVVTASFVLCAIGAFWSLRKTFEAHAAALLKVATWIGAAASIAVAFPTGDQQAKLVAKHQPVALAAMEGRFESGSMAGITLIGQPNVAEHRLDNPIRVPGALSFLAYGTFHEDVKGLSEFPESTWPTNIELLYYGFHLMAGIGTIMIGIMALAKLFEWRGRLQRTRPALWMLMLAFPLPYIATTAGWMTAELGRQPWLVYGILRTADGSSANVHSGDALFTLIGFAGLYLVLGVIFLFLVAREISEGPQHA